MIGTDIVALPSLLSGVRAGLGTMHGLHPAAVVIPDGGAFTTAGRLFDAAQAVILASVGLSAIILASILLVTTIQLRRLYSANLEERTHRLQREYEQKAELAIIEERHRIAREMHDVVAHSLAVVVTLADGAAATIGKDPDLAANAMNQAAETGRLALTDMRRIIGVIRSERGEELQPLPDLARIDDLLQDVATLGLHTSFLVDGEPGKLPRTAETTIYRIVQECLTNVIKHSHESTRVDVLLRWLDDAIEVEVRDDGAPVASQLPRGGHGFRGMLERTAVFGGDVRFGPTQPRGWSVRARLRLDGSVR